MCAVIDGEGRATHRPHTNVNNGVATSGRSTVKAVTRGHTHDAAAAPHLTARGLNIVAQRTGDEAVVDNGR
jgi:hypothetical protein